MRARERGQGQLGSLGAGNHFLEVQVVDRVEDPETARAFGLAEGMITVMIHCGSRGLGHQTCQEQVRSDGSGHGRIRDRSAGPSAGLRPGAISRRRGYLGAMAAAANFAWSNRHVLAHETRHAFADALGISAEETGMDLVYDVAHNLAKLERHQVDGQDRLLCVHRKGATRAFGPGHPDLPEDLQASGPAGLSPRFDGNRLLGVARSSRQPRLRYRRTWGGPDDEPPRRPQGPPRRRGQRRTGSQRDLGAPGSIRLLAEEADYAYKDVSEVARVCEAAGLAGLVARNSARWGW
jgi:tRNA-splicing ligase RtcB (3'-phosphate/5'-hydroxy nucleic acid ligase)